MDSETITAAIPTLANPNVRRMVAFAVMTVDWKSQQRSYLDNFINYVLMALPTTASVAFPRDAIRKKIESKFNLRLPEGVVQQIVKRAERLALVQVIDRTAVSLTAAGKAEITRMSRTIESLAQEQVNVGDAFSRWCDLELGLSVEADDAISMLLDYVETYFCSLMTLADGEGSKSTDRFPGVEPSPRSKLCASFIADIFETDRTTFDSVANMARGSMMVNALFAPTLVDTTRRFRKTTLYFDTKIAFQALGYEGEAASESTRELLEILKGQGARLGILEPTLREIRSVIDYVGARAANGQLWSSRPGTVEDYFYRIRASSSVIEQHSVRIEGRLLNLGFEIDSPPHFQNHHFVVDESAIEDTLRRGNPNYRPPALRHDVELIAAMVRARGGGARGFLEESRATFVTLNSLVVSTARAVQREYQEIWPIAMFETDVATLAWVKEPLGAPALPRNQLIANSLGLTNPSKQDWALIVAELSRLMEGSEISDDDLVLIRQKYETTRLDFLDATPKSQQEHRAAVLASVDSARSKVEAELTAPLRSELATSKAQIRDLEANLQSKDAEANVHQDESDRYLQSLLKLPWRMGGFIQVIVTGMILIALAAVVATSFVPGVEAHLASVFGAVSAPLTWVIRLFAGAATLVGGFWGPIREIGKYSRRKYLLYKLRNLDIDPSRAAEVGFKV